jgi:hypothetical protein
LIALVAFVASWQVFFLTPQSKSCPAVNNETDDHPSSRPAVVLTAKNTNTIVNATKDIHTTSDSLNHKNAADRVNAAWNASVESLYARWDHEMSKLDWTVAERCARDNTELPMGWLKRYLQTVAPFMEIETGSLAFTEPPKRPAVDCTNARYKHVLTGRNRTRAIRIFDLAPLAYELDILEIRLFELEHVVDEFAVLEGTMTHVGVQKPLYFARNRERFSRWDSQLRHFVWDDRIVLDSARHRENLKDSVEDWSLEKKTR